MKEWHEWNSDLARSIIERHKLLPGATLPILHALQECFGYIDRSIIPEIADALNLSKAEIHGVVSFYHDFRTTPPARHVLKLCRAEACQANGCEGLIKHLDQRHGLRPDQDDSPRLTIESVYCLGNCALGPAALLDGQPIARLTAAELDSIFALAI